MRAVRVKGGFARQSRPLTLPIAMPAAREG